MKLRIRQVVVLSFALCSLSLGLAAAFADGWPQWMQNPQHTGFLNVVGQNLNKDQLKTQIENALKNSP